MRKEGKAEYNKTYYENKKEKVDKKNKEWVDRNKVKIVCEVCNHEYPKYDKAHHIQRKYHLDALNTLNKKNVSLQNDNIREDGKAEA